MKNKYDSYEAAPYVQDKGNMAKILQDLVKDDYQIEKDPETLKSMMDLDLRDNVPPQLFELISCVVEMVQKVDEKVHKDESKSR